jgi:alkanesulfonate monooxygenase SsuD/methylene tetrahydromethanopterin reductase-like flavin-dependent oxidoreductase (luciferase family)
MDFAIAIPQFVPDGSFDPDGHRAFLARAEEVGFAGAWCQEQVLGTMANMGPIETLTFAAACTSRIRLGCAVFISTLYSPVHLAKSVSSLDQLSRGRLEIGIATGGRFRMFPAFGSEADELLPRFHEGLQLMQALWTETSVSFDGRFWQIEAGAMEPKPFQKPYPPIWFGGSHPNALRRAVRLGDGFFGAGSSTTDAFVDQVEVVRSALREQHRDPATFRIAKRIYVAVDDDGERARRRISDALDRLYGWFGLPNLLPVAVAGTPAECVEGVQRVVDAGAELVLLNPLFDDREQMERLATEVMPEVSS